MELQSLNLHNPVHVGYYDPYDLFPSVREEIESKLPLTNLHWKYHPSKPLKSITLLPIKLTEDKGDLKDVYAKVMFLKIDNIDVYRSQVRPLIKEWLKKTHKLNVEWMIVLYNPLSSKSKQSGLMKKSAFDKLKVDFGLHGKEFASIGVQTDDNDTERIFKVKEVYDDNISKLEAYNDIIASIKEFIVTTFGARFNQFQSEVNTPDSFQRVLAKIRVAEVLNDMKLFQDSLDIFNELSTEINEVHIKNPDLFDISMNLPSDFNDYNFETHFNALKFRSELLNYLEGKVNFFALKSYIFIQQSTLLQSLAHFASAISISSLFISRLYQDLLSFMDDLSKTFDINVDEFIYVVIDNYLNLPICIKLLDQQKERSDTNGEVYQLNDILEYHGELKLSQRSKLNKLAREKGLHVIGVDEILDDVKIDEKKPTKGSKPFSYKPLINALEDEDHYLDAVERITESAMGNFVSSERSKAIDILSIDLVFLHFHKKDYKFALDILRNSHQFFIENGWSYIGGVLLDVFLNCVEKVDPDNKKLILTTCLDLLANALSASGKIGINNYQLLKKKSQISKLVQKIQSYSHDNGVLEYPLQQILSVQILLHIEAQASKLDKYLIKLLVKNPFGVPFELQKISLTLSKVSDPKDTITFSLENIQVSNEEESIVELYSNVFERDSFSPKLLVFLLNDNLALFEQMEPHTDVEFHERRQSITTIVGNQSLNEEKSLNDFYGNSEVPDYPYFLSLMFYERDDKFWGEYSIADDIELGCTEFVLNIHNGASEAYNISIDISSPIDGVEIDEPSRNIKKLRDRETYTMKVPYQYFGSYKVLRFQTKISYEAENENFTYQFTDELDTTLRVSVVVQDIFKSQFLYSKFRVGSSDPRFPVRVTSKKLICNNDDYSVVSPKDKADSLIAVGDQPISLFYKVIPSEGYEIQSSDSFKLELAFSSLQDECNEQFHRLLYQKLKDASMQSFWFLFYNQLKWFIKYDLVKYINTKAIEISNRTELRDIIERLLISQVHLQNHTSLLKVFDPILEGGAFMPETETRCNKKLSITVPIPILDFLHVIRYEYNRKPHFMVGEPIRIKLIVSTISKWAAKGDKHSDVSVLAESSPNRSMTGHHEDESKEKFQLFFPNDDNWVLSGPKKFTFAASYLSNVINEIDVIMTPLSVGKMPLPRIQIKAFDGDKPNVSFDYDYENGSETLLVVPELSSITFTF